MRSMSQRASHPFARLVTFSSKDANSKRCSSVISVGAGLAYASAVALLIDSQNPLLDRSVSARLLSAINSLEAFEKARNNTGNINLRKVAQCLTKSTGSVGSDVDAVWKEQGQQKFGNSLARLRADYAAHINPGAEDHFPSERELLEQEWHLAALQWLLRCRYLQEMGLNLTEAADLVTEATDYQEVLLSRGPTSNAVFVRVPIHPKLATFSNKSENIVSSEL